MKVTPLFDRILVKRIEVEEKVAGGIIIPDTAKEKATQGEVVSVGKGKLLKDGSMRKLDVAAGSKVLFEKWAGTEIKIDGVEHIMLREDDVLGIVE